MGRANSPTQKPRAWGRPDWTGFGWATGEFGLACYVGITTIYLLFYATQVLHIPPVVAGLALLVPRVWNVVADPIVGILSDKTRTRFGRRRPYLLGGALLWGACFALLFNLSPLHDRLLSAVWFGMVFLVNNTGLSLYQVPYATMLAEISRDQQVRTRLAGYREIVSRAAILLTLAGGPWLLGHAASKAEGFRIIGVVFGIAIVVGGVAAFLATGDADVPVTAYRHLGLRTQVVTLVENRPLAWLSTSFLCVNIGDAVFSGALVYYITGILGHSPAAIGVLYPVSSVTGIIVAPLWWRTANRLGKIPVCRIALALNALCCLLPLGITTGRYDLMFPFMALYGFANTGARLVPNAMAPDTADLDQARTGERREGVIFSIFIFVQQTGFAVGGFLLSVFLAFGLRSVTAAGAPQFLPTAILLTFTLCAAALYGSAFFAILPYRMPTREGLIGVDPAESDAEAS
ncbi:MAG: MFS transporter [Pseudomonadota bacterium]|jgi:Na+/melibiose symporter-like transporter|nr:MFS transporter [Pseudomonadota bacterium]